jgi:PAS domain-containing protein
MKHKSPSTPWVITIAALVLVVAILVLGNQWFIATDKAGFDEVSQRQLVLAEGAPKEDARLLIRSAYLRQPLVVGLSSLTILLGVSYVLTTSFRTSKSLEKEVETKTAELRESHEKLQMVLDRLETAHRFQQSIIDGVAESIMVIGADYRVQLMNRAAREFSSGGASASKSARCYQISHRKETPCGGTEHPCPLKRVRESGQPVTVVHEHYQANGEGRFVELVASPL